MDIAARESSTPEHSLNSNVELLFIVNGLVTATLFISFRLLYLTIPVNIPLKEYYCLIEVLAVQSKKMVASLFLLIYVQMHLYIIYFLNPPSGGLIF